MNETQFKIVKIMQTIGISAERFAKACHVKPVVMRRAYKHGSWSQYQEDSEKYGGTMRDVMDIEV